MTGIKVVTPVIYSGGQNNFPRWSTKTKFKFKRAMRKVKKIQGEFNG